MTVKSPIRILKANILHQTEAKSFTCLPGGYLVLKDGVIECVSQELPEEYHVYAVEDHGDALLIPAFSDTHLHAPQYPATGMGMDLQLLEWLDNYTFPGESHFEDTGYAREVYAHLAKELIKKGTTRVSVFSSLHRESTLVLMEELEKAGISGFVGKVNMDRNSPDILREGDEAVAETRLWIEESLARFTNIKPIITPRFIPSCTDQLMEDLGKLKKKYRLRAQSHLSENLAEIQWVKELHPDCTQYWEAYAKYGMFEDRDLMAHCVYSDERERAALKEHGVWVSHSPDSNANIVTGIAPIRKMLDEGVKVCLASDIAGGSTLSMMRITGMAIRMSKARWLQTDKQDAPLTFPEAFYLATGAGAEFFGDKPGFVPGQKLHALLLTDASLPRHSRELTLPERLERLTYAADDSNILMRFAGGKEVG
ncbi:MAG: amidohydrolase family protein [Clostridia bacterium]|nr:amidohydrolase family protein [Clostridia bacterium]